MKPSAKIAKELSDRGLIHQCTSQDALEAFSNEVAPSTLGVYCGFDATADSLTVGHLLPLITLRRFQQCGFRVFPLLGTATAAIGDPTNRSVERPVLPEAAIHHNATMIQLQVNQIIPGVCIYKNDFTNIFRPAEFFREVGRFFSVNEMLRKDSIKNRLESGGLTFTEMSYMLFQAYDFFELNNRFNVVCQIGGSDQWSNIIAGLELIDKKGWRAPNSPVPFGLTMPLLLKPDGTKFGKSSAGAVWLDESKTSVWEFFQFWYNQPDDQIEKLLKFFSLEPLKAIESLLTVHQSNPSSRMAQRFLAREMVALVHGWQRAIDCNEISAALFDGEWEELSEFLFDDIRKVVGGIDVNPFGYDDIAGLFILSGLVNSKSDYKRLVESGGLRMNGEVVVLGQRDLPGKLYHNRFLVLQKGKKDFRIAEFSKKKVSTDA